MKRIIVITLCLLLLCACGADPKPTEPANTTSPLTTTEPTVTTVPSTQESTAEPNVDAFSLAESCIGKSVDELVALIGEPESSD
jgi:PBP1b-binding outer membrane lipoprotein LpoB